MSKVLGRAPLGRSLKMFETFKALIQLMLVSQVHFHIFLMKNIVFLVDCAPQEVKEFDAAAEDEW